MLLWKLWMKASYVLNLSANSGGSFSCAAWRPIMFLLSPEIIRWIKLEWNAAFVYVVERIWITFPKHKNPHSLQEQMGQKSKLWKENMITYISVGLGGRILNMRRKIFGMELDEGADRGILVTFAWLQPFSTLLLFSQAQMYELENSCIVGSGHLGRWFDLAVFNRSIGPWRRYGRYWVPFCN